MRSSTLGSLRTVVTKVPKSTMGLLLTATHAFLSETVGANIPPDAARRDMIPKIAISNSRALG